MDDAGENGRRVKEADADEDREEEDEIADGSEHDKYVSYGTLQHNCHLHGCVAGLNVLGKKCNKGKWPKHYRSACPSQAEQ